MDRHFLQDPVQLVQTSLESIPLLNPSVALDTSNRIIYRLRRRRTDSNNGQQEQQQSTSPSSNPPVALVSGGGSGHEPSFTSYVGEGLLTASVAGSIFASPSAEAIRQALLKRVDVSRGVVVIIMNYTGDVLNFGMAVEKVKAASSGGINIETVIVGDDVGVGKKQAGKVGRRGIAGTVLVHKIAGALAATGASFKEVHHVAQLVSENLISVGASLGHVHVPGSSKNNSESRTDIESNEIEIGMGIHNEPGSQTIQSYDLPSLIKKLLSQLLDQNDEDRAFLEIDPRKHKMVLMVNNLGGVSVLEMGGITTEVVSQLKNDYDVKPVGILSGVYMTSLNGMGFSITLLRLMDTGLGVGKDMLDLLDAPAQAVGWSNVLSPEIWSTEWEDVEENNMPGDTNGDFGSSTLKMDPSQAERALKAGLESIVAAEPEITDYDTKVGDGDCGISLKRGAEAILNAISHGHLPLNDAIQTTSQISQIIENTMDGTSGAIYSIFLNALTHSLRTSAPSSPSTSITITPNIWSTALQEALKVLGRYTPAQRGDRTLIDSLQPFIQVLQWTNDIRNASHAASTGAQSTRNMRPRLGRTVYIGGEKWRDVPDPGAYGVSVFLKGLAGTFGEERVRE